MSPGGALAAAPAPTSRPGGRPGAGGLGGPASGLWLASTSDRGEAHPGTVGFTAGSLGAALSTARGRCRFRSDSDRWGLLGCDPARTAREFNMKRFVLTALTLLVLSGTASAASKYHVYRKNGDNRCMIDTRDHAAFTSAHPGWTCVGHANYRTDAERIFKRAGCKKN